LTRLYNNPKIAFAKRLRHLTRLYNNPKIAFAFAKKILGLLYKQLFKKTLATNFISLPKF